MKLIEDWHRVLALGGDQRPIGKAITGACNLAFFVLAVSGLYLWWPRKWRTKGLRRSIWFIRRPADAKARDWNWHNVIGLWTAPILIVLTLTALPISYKWAGQMLFTITGTPPPPPTTASATPAAKLVPPTPGAKLLSSEDLIAVAQKQFPTWETLTYRAGTTQPATIAVRTADSWPRTATTTLSLNPFTGEILKRAGYASSTPPNNSARGRATSTRARPSVGPVNCSLRLPPSEAASLSTPASPSSGTVGAVGDRPR